MDLSFKIIELFSIKYKLNFWKSLWRRRSYDSTEMKKKNRNVSPKPLLHGWIQKFKFPTNNDRHRTLNFNARAQLNRTKKEKRIFNISKYQKTETYWKSMDDSHKSLAIYNDSSRYRKERQWEGTKRRDRNVSARSRSHHGKTMKRKCRGVLVKPSYYR